MDVLTLLVNAHHAQLALVVAGDKLSVSGPNTPGAAAVVAQLAEHKAAVIAHLHVWPTLQPAEKMMALSDRLGFTWERLPDGRYWFSRWDSELFREATKLIHEIDHATGKPTNNTEVTQ